MTSLPVRTFLSMAILILLMVESGHAQQGGIGDWSDWELDGDMADCRWSRYRFPDWGEYCDIREIQQLNCTCSKEPWNDWIPISLVPCLEARSRGEIRTVEDNWCVDRFLRAVDGSPRPTGAVPDFDCYETRDCDDLNLPCNDNPAIQALARLCATKITRDDITSVEEWGDVCEDERDAIECIRQYSQCTSSEAEVMLSSSLHCLFVEICDAGSLKTTIQTMLDDVAFDQSAIDAIDFTPCLDLLDERSPALQEQLSRAALSCMRDFIGNAGLTGVNNQLARLMAQFMVNCTVFIVDLGPTSAFYDFKLPRCTMRLYGDPHVETCSDTTGQTTCAAPGLQTYLDIFFLKITGVNTQWRTTSLVTVLTEVTVEFKSLIPPHNTIAIYKASGGALPTSFQFGLNTLAAIDTVFLTTWNRRVELVWPHTGVVIIIQNWGATIYQFTMRASQAVMNTGTGILIDGCPPGQALGRRRRRRNIFAISKRDEDAASADVACRAQSIPAGTADMEACIYDVIISNDPGIAGATAMAIEDEVRAISRDRQAIRQAGVWSIDIPAGFQYCVDGEEVAGCRDCERDEFLLHPTDCSSYFHCLVTGKALLRSCFPSYLRFSLAGEHCDWPWNVECEATSGGNGGSG